jgi:hypothetical protein
LWFLAGFSRAPARVGVGVGGGRERGRRSLFFFLSRSHRPTQAQQKHINSHQTTTPQTAATMSSSEKHQHDEKKKGLVGSVGGHVALTDERVAEEMRSEQHAHGGGVVPKGSLAARMQSAKDRYDNTQEARKEEEKEGPIGRGAVGGKGVAAKPQDLEPDVCPP